MKVEQPTSPGLSTTVLGLVDGSRGTNQNAAIDGLRGLSVALVFFVHLPLWLAPWLAPGVVEHTAVHIMGVGQTGVDIFFALSGYLIYGGLLARRQSYGSFLSRRLQRLYPLYIVTLIVVMFIRTAGTGSLDWMMAGGNPLALLLLNLCMVPNWAGQPPIYGVTWTLTWEWQFYLVMPLIVMALGMRDRSRSFRVAALIGIWGAQATAASFGDRGIIRYAAFGAGSLAAEWIGARNERRARGEEVRSMRLPGIVAAFITTAIVLYGSIAGAPTHRVEEGQIKLDLSWDNSVIHELIFRWAFLIIVPVVLVAAIDEQAGISRFLRNQWLRRLGVVSYSFYLCHYMVTRLSLQVLAKVLVPGEVSNAVAMVIGSVLAITLTMVVTMIAFVFVERPLSLGRDPFITVVPPKLVRRPGWNDFLPGWRRSPSVESA